MPPGLLFFHGTARAEKLWPEAHWVELAELASGRAYCIWLPWGMRMERERAERIAQRHRPCRQGRYYPGWICWAWRSMLLEVSGAVAVDTGLGHLARLWMCPPYRSMGRPAPA